MNNKLYKYHLSLGSNIEPRNEFLTQSVTLLQKYIGEITAYSKIYETPAWGFTSTSFLNACIKIESKVATKEVLIIIQKIEIEIGRKRKAGTNYEARPIDIDILYASEGIFNYENLVVPHPLLQDRKFVLVPLNDIASGFVHPLLHFSTAELLESCEDNAEVKASFKFEV